LLVVLANLRGMPSAIAEMQESIPPAASTAEQSDRAAWDVPPLKDAAKDAFLIGTALDYQRWRRRRDPVNDAIAMTHFNAITPENSMKPMFLQPFEGYFSFDSADRLVELAER
ncbi:MAG TPA: endo-1,4-beta-xylanase, partial [Gammaproteobacteria bacterium]|nr:endo-1,4-beta-xylanase [Gammaproteobacteria bacterium]